MFQLKYIDEAIARRKLIDTAYRNGLHGVQRDSNPRDFGEAVWNYAYFPILVSEDFPLGRNDLYTALKEFEYILDAYPLISSGPDVPDYPLMLKTTSGRKHQKVFAYRYIQIRQKR